MKQLKNIIINSDDYKIINFNRNVGDIKIICKNTDTLDKLLIRKSDYDSKANNIKHCSTDDAVDNIIKGIDETHSWPFLHYANSIIATLKENIDMSKKYTIIEIGCNNARIPKMLYANNYLFCETYIGGDIELAFTIEGINKNFKPEFDKFPSYFQYVDMNEQLPWCDNLADIIICAETFDHIGTMSGSVTENRKAAKKFFFNLKRILKPGGKIIMSNLLDHPVRPLEKIGRETIGYHPDHPQCWNRYAEKNELQIENLFKECGLTIIDIHSLMTFGVLLEERAKTDPIINDIVKHNSKVDAKWKAAELMGIDACAVVLYVLESRK